MKLKENKKSFNFQ